ncbi:MAG: imidazoleglycerol-phosphate dehydratase HisB [Nanoarchaeota archaeon]|nr:imidazoleglycerol-phosphate dehydratase HisB [Nanoarchaeota archaeon]
MPQNRASEIKRKTNETDVKLMMNLDGKGQNKIITQVGFLNHMLELFAKNSLIDLDIKATGDIEVDEHHTVEDIGIVLGQAISKAIGDKKGINRYGTSIIPMDEVLALVSLDLSGRYAFCFDCNFSREKIGDLSTELVYDFFEAIAQNAKMNLHIKLLTPGRNDHHRIEAIFKAFGRAIKEAASIDERLIGEIPSTKGVL